MKKVLSVLLSLIFMLGILAVPTTAQGNYSNKVPKTVIWYIEKVGIETRIAYLEKETQLTASYNASKKELTYNANRDNAGDNLTSEALFIGMASASTDTKLNQDYARCGYTAAMNSSNDFSDKEYALGTYSLRDKIIITGVVINDSIRTGKIQKLIINFGTYRIIMTFTTKGNHVTEMTYTDEIPDETASVSNWKFEYSYDSNGNIIKIEQNYYPYKYEITVQHRNNQITLIDNEYLELSYGDLDESESHIPQYDNSGNLVYIKYKEEDNSIKQKLHNHYYLYQLSYNQDKTISTFDYFSCYHTYTYFSI